MIYDCFPFFNELDLLEIRLNILKDVVDKFVIAEAPWTHSGLPKQLLRPIDMERFAAFRSKIVYVIAGAPPTSESLTHRQNAWIRENCQRNELAKGLIHAKPNDLILLSDLDEIPDPAAIQKARFLPGVTRFDMRFYNFFLNFRNYSVPNWPIGTQACTYKTFLDETTYSDYIPDQFVPKEANKGSTLSKLRMVAAKNKLPNAGWHFSYCGGIDAVIKKLEAFAHTECKTKKATDPEAIKAALLSGKDSVGRGYRFFAEPIDEAFPEYIRNNLTKLERFVVPCDAAYLKRTRLPRLMTLLRGKAYRLMVRCIPPFLAPFAMKVRNALWTLRCGKSID